MIEHRHHINYTAEDIRKYLSGELTPLQMNAMEKAALDDSFLAEAIEGYQSVPVEDWQAALIEAQRQLTQEKNSTKIIALPSRKNNWWKVAAAAIVILSTAVITYFTINRKQETQIAKVVTIPASIDNTATFSPDSNSTSKGRAENIAANKLSIEKIAEEKNNSRLQNKEVAENKIVQHDSNFVFTPAPAKTSPVVVASIPKSNDDASFAKEEKEVVITSSSSAANNANRVQTNNNLNNNQALFDKQTNAYKKEFNKDQQLSRNFSAQVVAPDNTPLPFANVSIKNENFGTYADVKGNFRLVSTDSVLTVEVKSVGYQPKLYTLKSNLQLNKITLVEDDIMASRQKTVISSPVSAKSKVSRKATLIKDSIVNVEPADGWSNYNTYVDNNFDIPDNILNNNIHGQVELSFEVKANGTLTNIKVDKSLCDNCDEVAKRLIEQGPQWKVKKGKKGKGKITVQF